MISSLHSTVSNSTHSIKYDHNPLSSTDIQINLEDTMNEPNADEEKINEDDDDENNNDETSRLVSIEIESKEEQTSVLTLRSILRKRNERKMSGENFRLVQHTSISMEEDDSDYTGDENEENDDDDDNDHEEEKESNVSNKSIEEKSENNEQEQHRHYYNYSRHQQQQKKKNQFFRTSPSTPLDFPLSAETGITTTFYPTDPSLTRPACVTFTKDQPIVIHRSSSTPQLGGTDLQPRTSITYINMREDLSTTIPITTTASQGTTLMTEFRPVYVSPLKYRPLVGLSANDNRLLLEKRVSLLGKPLIFHPIQKRSPAYRRNQLRIYNFLERPHGCKAIIYHTFV